MELDVVSILIAEATVLVPLTAFFLGIRFQIRRVEEVMQRSHKQDGDAAKVLQEITTSLATLTRDHGAIMERHASAARRADKSIEALERISVALATLNTDHQRLMDAVAHSAQRVLDRVDVVTRPPSPGTGAQS